MYLSNLGNGDNRVSEIYFYSYYVFEHIVETLPLCFKRNTKKINQYQCIIEGLFILL